MNDSRETMPATERIERLFLQRVELLQSVRSDISEALYEAIGAKIDYEKRFLLERAAQRALRVAAKRQSSRILKPEYFQQAALDAHLL